MIYIEQLLCAFLGTLGFTILFNVHKKFYLTCGLTGMFGWLVYMIIVQFSTKYVAGMFGTMAVLMLSRIFAVYKKCPTTVFLVSGIFPLLPSPNIYYTAYYLVTNDLGKASQNAVSSLKFAVAMVIGISIISAIPNKFFLKEYWAKK